MKITPKMEELVLKVIEEMESGKSLPWEKPWFYQGVMNWKTKRGYNGMNILSLAYGLEDSGLKIGQFMTYNQAQKEGAQVKKGAHGFPVCYFQMIEGKGKNNEKTKFPLMKTSIVFGIEQIEGIEARETPKRDLTPNELAEKIISLSGAKMIENGATTSTPAFCKNDGSSISVPSKNLWKTDEGFYSTVFHELIHWTGSKERLNRSSFVNYSTERAFEELIAELGGAFLASYVGYHYNTQHTAYIKSWASGMKEHKDMLYKASSQAQKAVNYILKEAGLIETKEEAKEEEPVTA